MDTAKKIGGLAEVLRTHGIVRAVVIDDAFDVAIADTVSDEMCGTFQAELKRNPTIAEELGTVGVDAAAVLKKDAPALEALAAMRDKLEKARPYVETLLYDYLDRRALVDDLVRHLKTLELDVVALGADQPIPGDLEAGVAASLIFTWMIEFLREIDGHGARGRSVHEGENKAHLPESTIRSRAFVVLMSSREEVSQEGGALRKKAESAPWLPSISTPKPALSDDRFTSRVPRCDSAADSRVSPHSFHDFAGCLDEAVRFAVSREP